MDKDFTKNQIEQFLTRDILRQLGIKTKKQLLYDGGSYHIKKKFRLNFVKEFINFNEPKELFSAGEVYKLPVGASVILKSTTLSKGPRPKNFSQKVSPIGWNKDINVKKENYIHRGHIIAHELYPDDSWDSEKEKKYFTQTEWCNKSSKPDKQGKLKIGKNFAFYESDVKSFLEKNQDGKVLYFVELLYDRNDLIPRGVHLRYKCLKKIACHRKCVCSKRCFHSKKCKNDCCQTFKTVKSCNIFIPNADPRLNIDYRKSEFKFVKN